MTNDIHQEHGEHTQVFAVIHGHFYQPPRENPWTGRIPQQESASPYHDWNERIMAECYKPNTRSRVLDEEGKIVRLENNFAYLNFNLGPTLFSWIEQECPDVYHNILEADALSCERNQGHGNAIAQVYNHVILPLANERDKVTQIVWGIREFEHRFKRKPESIWLAETAINEETVKCLIEQGIKYVILSPTQAMRVKSLEGDEWTDVSDNSIDTTQAYRIFLKEQLPDEIVAQNAEDESFASEEENGGQQEHDGHVSTPRYRFLTDRSIDAFFYDGALSNDISFNHLLQDAEGFARRINEIAAHSPHANVLVHVATDGEIYGHHEPSGDMSLATVLTSKCPQANIKVINYGRFLELNPPTKQVDLKPGSDQGEGTSWSCSHGVGRWYRDCGCVVDSPEGWNQKWRTPLREGFDILRGALAELFEQRSSELLYDPWNARNDYIDCLLHPSDDSINAFLSRHATHDLNHEEQTIVLRLLEAQKYAMFAYTSCAWFFNDVSGLEPMQNMRYAARAIQLVQGLVSPDIEERMLDAFERAQSNMPQFGTGRDIYQTYIKPDIYTPERAANQFLLEKFVQQQRMGTDAKKVPAQGKFSPEERKVHIYWLRCPDSFTWHEVLKGEVPEETEQAEGEEEKPKTRKKRASMSPYASIYSGVLDVFDTTTRTPWKLLFTTFTEQSGHPAAYLKVMKLDDELTQLTSSISQHFSLTSKQLDLPGLASFIEQCGLKRYTLADFYEEDREQLFSTTFQDYSHHVEQHIETVYKDSIDLLDYLTTASLQVPAKLHASVEFSLSYHLMIEMEKLYSKEIGDYSPACLREAIDKVMHLRDVHRLTLDMELLKKRLTDALTQYLIKLSQRFLRLERGNYDALEAAEWEDFLLLLRDTLELIEASGKLGVRIDNTDIQNMTHDILENTIPRYLDMFKSALENAGQTESESAHQELHRFFREYKFLRGCLRLARRLNFNIDRYKEVLISAELALD